MSRITTEELASAMPSGYKGKVPAALVSDINSIVTDDEFAAMYRENLIGSTSIITQGKFSMEQYVSAVRYVSYKFMGKSNKDSYYAAFPDKIAAFAAKGVDAKTISSYVFAYNASKLVTLLLKQAMIPVYLANADSLQKAINIQVELMSDDGVSPMVRQQAANSLITNLKQPETAKIELDVTTIKSSAIEDLEAAVSKLTQMQLKELNSGSSSVKDVAESRIIDAKCEDVSDE